MIPVTPMQVILATAVALVGITFWWAHRSTSNFNAFDLVMVGGKVDRVAFAFMLVLGVSTWIMVDLQISDKMTEGFLTIYTGAWIVPLVAKIVFGKNEMPGMSSTSTTTVVARETSVVEPSP